MVAGEVDDAADQFFARNVLGVGLSSDNELHPSFRSVAVNDFLDAIQIPQKQGGPFVGGKATGKANGEHKGVEAFLGFR